MTSSKNNKKLNTNQVIFDKQGENKATKRLFIGLVTISSLFICLILIFLWIIPNVGFSAIHPFISYVFGFFILCIILIVLWASFGLVIYIITKKTIPFYKQVRGVTVQLSLPIMIVFGKLFKIQKDRIRASFIEVNNDLVLSTNNKFKPKDILILLPHCLQSSKCKIRLTYNIFNCKRCGECPLAGLIELSEKYAINIAIATGGTIARRIVVQKKPKLIFAVACERDLSSGVQDTYPLPVYGVLNLRPHGPCLDTTVDLNKLEEAIKRFI